MLCEDGVSNDQMLDHVEGCSCCQKRLYELAGSDCEWNEVAIALKDCSDNEATSFNDRFDPTKLYVQPWLDCPEQWTDEAAAALLEPPVHPEILGRLGRYEIERLIGSGGMGIVFKAYDQDLR